MGARLSDLYYFFSRKESLIIVRILNWKTKRSETNAKTTGHAALKLKTTVNLVWDVRRRPIAPLAAGLSDDFRDLELLDLVRVREELDQEAGGDVPSNVAVEGPDA